MINLLGRFSMVVKEQTIGKSSKNIDNLENNLAW